MRTGSYNIRHRRRDRRRYSGGTKDHRTAITGPCILVYSHGGGSCIAAGILAETLRAISCVVARARTATEDSAEEM